MAVSFLRASRLNFNQNGPGSKHGRFILVLFQKMVVLPYLVLPTGWSYLLAGPTCCLVPPAAWPYLLAGPAPLATGWSYLLAGPMWEDWLGGRTTLVVGTLGW